MPAMLLGPDPCSFGSRVDRTVVSGSDLCSWFCATQDPLGSCSVSDFWAAVGRWLSGQASVSLAWSVVVDDPLSPPASHPTVKKSTVPSTPTRPRVHLVPIGERANARLN